MDLQKIVGPSKLKKWGKNTHTQQQQQQQQLLVIKNVTNNEEK